MKTAKRLKLLIDLFCVVFILTLIITLFNSFQFYYEIKSSWMKDISIEGFIFKDILYLIRSSIFVFGILSLRKSIKFILNKEYFSKPVTMNLNRSGIAFILTAVLFIGRQFDLMLNRPDIPGENFSDLFYTESSGNYALFLTIIGLFFILVGYVFSEAGQLKQENDLTI